MSNRFPADDEHLHLYPGNLKHHKVSPAMKRTIPEVYRAALATLESLIEDGYDHAKERQRKLLCEMMKDDAKSGLYNEKKREPLLSDGEVYSIVDKWQTMEDTEWDCACNAVSEAIELHEAARAKDAELIQQLFDALYAEQFVPSLGPSPLTKPAIAAAAAAGFKRTEP
jgi:hypothetical protein